MPEAAGTHGYLLTRPVSHPPIHMVRTHASFSYQAGSWDKKRRVVAKVEWHPYAWQPENLGCLLWSTVSKLRNKHGTVEKLNLTTVIWSLGE